VSDSGGVAPPLMISAPDGGEWSASVPRYPPYRRLGDPKGCSGRYEEENYLLPLSGIEALLLESAARNLATILTELSGSYNKENV
jgi:hypothetical protein